MKKVVLAVLGVVVVLVAGAAIFLLTKKPAQRPPSPEQIAGTPERLARGAYLTEHVLNCTHCHSVADAASFGHPPKEGTAGIGGNCWSEEMGIPGHLCATNLTPDPDTGLGRWTDGEILRAFREGVSRDGHALFPLMPYGIYRTLSDEDAASVVAYLRTLKPVRNPIPARVLKMPTKVIVNFIPRPIEGPVAAPDRKDPLAYGRYLATVGGCEECHTPQDDHHQPIAGREFAGGRDFGGVRSANITPDDTGIREMTRDQFIDAFKTSAERRPVAPERNSEMGWMAYAGMTEEDLGALYDFLRTVKPVKNDVETWPKAVATDSK